MKLQCTHCGEVYEGTITRKGNGWYSVCPHCKKDSEYEIPDKKIVMLFLDDNRDDYEDFFTNGLMDGTPIISCYAYDSEKEFLEGWNKIKENPDSMWYWVFKDGEQICSGACDPGDIYEFLENFEDYVWLEATDRCFYVNKEWLKITSTEAAYENDLFEGEFHFDLFLENCSTYEASRYYVKAKEEGAILYEYYK